jgi:hypothetical protein
MFLERFGIGVCPRNWRTAVLRKVWDWGLPPQLAYSQLAYSQVFEEFGRGEWIRTTDLLVPNQAL